MFKVIFLTLLLAYSASADFWTPCTDLIGVIAPNLIVSPSCPPTADRCSVTRGEELEADVHFTPVRGHEYLDVRVTAFVLGIGIDLTPEDEDACDNIFIGAHQHTCPTIPNQEHIWRIQLFISRLYPAFNNARVRFLLSEGGRPEGCADVRATLI